MADVDMQRGDRIAKLRKEHGWNQDEFASRVGICRQSMSCIENGHGIKHSTLVRMASVLGVTTDYILKGSCKNENKKNLIGAINSELESMEEVELKKCLAMIQVSKRLSA